MMTSIHWPRAARMIADATGLDYNTVTLPAVEAIMGTPGATFGNRQARLHVGDTGAYFTNQVGSRFPVDTSEGCSSCGGSALQGPAHPDSCHTVRQQAMDDARLTHTDADAEQYELRIAMRRAEVTAQFTGRAALEGGHRG